MTNTRWEYTSSRGGAELRALGEEGWEAYAAYAMSGELIHLLKRGGPTDQPHFHPAKPEPVLPPVDDHPYDKEYAENGWTH